MKSKILLGLALLPAVAVNSAIGASSEKDKDLVAIPDTSRAAVDMQTVLKKAKPFKNPLPAPDTSAVQPEVGEASSTIPGVKGVKGVKGTASSNAEAYGSFSVPYTSKRVSHKSTSSVSSSSGAYLSATYPYRAIGKLTFKTPSGGSGFCSASLIRRSVIVTAAHCFQDFGSGSSHFSNFSFTPATYNGSAPYGSWTASAVARAGSWADGTDIGTGGARDNDVALFIINQKSGKFIGDTTGYFGYGWNNYSFVSSSKTGNLKTGAVSTLGYPGLLDNGRIMQRSDGPSYLTTISDAGQIYQGSDFTGGSSGGPWIVNFGYQNPARNGGAAAGSKSTQAIIGVTSWGASDPNTPKDNYASQFRQNKRYPNSSYGSYGAGNIGSLMNTLCSAKPSGSTQTYAQLGYCK